MKHGKNTSKQTRKQPIIRAASKHKGTYNPAYTIAADDFSPRAFFACYPELRKQENWWNWLSGDIPGFARMSIDQRRAAAFALVGGEPLPELHARVMEVAPRRQRAQKAA